MDNNRTEAWHHPKCLDRQEFNRSGLLTSALAAESYRWGGNRHISLVSAYKIPRRVLLRLVSTCDTPHRIHFDAHPAGKTASGYRGQNLPASNDFGCGNWNTRSRPCGRQIVPHEDRYDSRNIAVTPLDSSRALASFPNWADDGSPHTQLPGVRLGEETWSWHGRSLGAPSIELSYGKPRIPQAYRRRVLPPFVRGIDRCEDRYDRPCRNDPQTDISRE